MNKYIKGFLSLILITIFSSCIKDYVSNTETFLINNTNHVIEIYPYTGGFTHPSNKVIIYPNQRISVLKENVRGKSLNPIYGTNLQPFDSTVVTFDTIYRVTHRSFRDSATLCSKCIAFSNTRNISNEENYIETVTKNHKKFLRGYYEYIFTEDDYNFARQ
ncbi:MAG: hypothetical protein JNM21_13175 [Taibaiella sp.]|nr:hypothetical protein [Taibaiella sp.]